MAQINVSGSFLGQQIQNAVQIQYELFEMNICF